MCYKRVQGTNDFFENDSILLQDVLNNIINNVELYNYKYIKTPIIESSELFKNFIGKNTDIISKELYNLDNSISLRPEGTSGVARCYLENKMYNKENFSKFYYYGSMFRNEKVQNNRYKEFQQFGIEVFNTNDYIIDLEVILLAYNIFKAFGLNNIKLYINNLGSNLDKEKYEKDLKEYFKRYYDLLCDDCKKRFNDNPIRILDCKKDKNKDFVLDTIKIESYVNKDSKEKFDKIVNKLTESNIDFEINKNLVRGANYYTDIVFEIKASNDNFKTRITLCGGGRYNSSIKLNDKYIPAIGFAIGLERLIKILKEKTAISREI